MNSDEPTDGAGLIAPSVIITGILVVSAVFGFLIVPEWPRHFQTREQRIDYLQKSIWCPICEGESLATSQTKASKTLRETIRSMVRAGKSNRDIYRYIRRRYSSKQIAVPRTGRQSRVSYGLPYFLVGILIAGVYWITRRWVNREKRNRSETTLSTGDEQTIRELVKHVDSPLE